jgi:hypothetical protein
MHRRFLVGLALLASSAVLPRRGSADPAPIANQSAVYDAVDAVEAWADRVAVTGIISGQSDVTTLLYPIEDSASNTTTAAARCDRFALLAMSKPGKYQFATVFQPDGGGFRLAFSCKLILRAP